MQAVTILVSVERLRSQAADGAARALREIRERPLLTLSLLLVLSTVIFLVLPGLDLAFSRQFFQGDMGFVEARRPVPQALREFSGYVTVAVIAACLAGLLAPAIAGWRRFGLKPSDALYVLTVYVVGPGLVVNGLFKNLFGRARPREIVEFGGGDQFTSIWTIMGDCTSNCSFVSGEGSSAAALLTLALITPRDYRMAALAGLGSYAFVISLNRIAFGGHFLSDVVIAWILVLIFATAIRPLFTGERGLAIDEAVSGARRYLEARRTMPQAGAAQADS